MDRTCSPEFCDDCPSNVICRCLNVTEDALVHAITVQGLQTLREIRTQTGAGDGCTCCHARIQQTLARLRQTAAAACA